MPGTSTTRVIAFVVAVIFTATAACGRDTSDTSPHDEPARALGPAPTDSDAGAGGGGATTTALASEPATPASADAGAPSSCIGKSVLAAGDTTISLASGGRTRTAFVHVPPNGNGRALPLVFDFHPLSVDASTWRLATGWKDVADKEGFILVVPQGVGSSWNAGRCCGDAHDGAVDDVAFVRDLTRRIANDACVDARRVYATGCSNGGGMAYRIACEAADLVAAVAPVDFDCVTGPTNAASCASCTPSRPISVVQFRGTADNFVPYGGGPTSVVAGFEFPGARANFADWGAKNGCSGSAEAIASRPLCEHYPTCGAGAETELCTLPLGVHCGSYIPFGIAKVAWDVMKAHPLP